MKQLSDSYTKDIFDVEKTSKKMPFISPVRKCSICGKNTNRCMSICSIGQLGRKEKT